MDAGFFLNVLQKNGINFFTGVPDSYLNAFCDYVLQNSNSGSHVIAANEGNAIGIASGYFLATKKIPLVYMQNSGLGNALNPLASLVDVYDIPMLLLVGWRGAPGDNDWKQHKLQGEITPKLFEIMNIPYTILQDDEAVVSQIVKNATEYAGKQRRPYALISQKGVLSGEKKNNYGNQYTMTRKDAIEILLNELPKDTIFIATTGRATRDLFYLREERHESHSNDFLNVGAMGHASSIGLGIALQKKRNIVILDGDAGAIMHLGAFAIIGTLKPPNLLHIVLNNGLHDSVGGMPSAGFDINLTKIAEATGYKTIGDFVSEKEELIDSLKSLKNRKSAGFIDVHINTGSNKLPSINFSHRKFVDEFIDDINS